MKLGPILAENGYISKITNLNSALVEDNPTCMASVTIPSIISAQNNEKMLEKFKGSIIKQNKKHQIC